MPLDKYDTDFDWLEEASKDLLSINLRAYNGRHGDERAAKAGEFRELVREARDAVVACHNALVELEAYDIEREEGSG